MIYEAGALSHIDPVVELHRFFAGFPGQSSQILIVPLSIDNLPETSMDSADRPVPARRFSPFNVCITIVSLVLVLGGLVGWYWLEVERDARKVADVTPTFSVAVDFPMKLEARFKDADGDLVADPPADAREWLDPEMLVFATLGSDATKEAADWADFIVYLKEVTGKEVRIESHNFLNRKQFEEIAGGKLHVIALSTGSVVPAVNVGGFVPVCVMADADGKFGYEMEIIVPSDRTNINSLHDLKGKRVGFANFQSHSGFKLPVVTLWEAGLLYERDYQFTYTGGQTNSVREVRMKRCDAVGVANDVLKRELAAERITKDDYRTIYTSGTFPSACFGYVNTLKPELAANIRKAFLKFPWAGSSLEKAYKGSEQVKFVPIEYAKDWAAVRATDESLRKVFETKP